MTSKSKSSKSNKSTRTITMKSKSNKSSKPSKSIKLSKSPKSIRTSRKVAKVVRPVNRTMVISKSLVKNLTMDEMITLITDAIQFKFRSDKTKPGLTIAKLGNGEMYVSVVRFNSPFGKDKVVEYKARSTDIMTALYSVAQQITGQKVEVNPVDRLSRYIAVPSSV